MSESNSTFNSVGFLTLISFVTQFLLKCTEFLLIPSHLKDYFLKILMLKTATDRKYTPILARKFKNCSAPMFKVYNLLSISIHS